LGQAGLTLLNFFWCQIWTSGSRTTAPSQASERPKVRPKPGPGSRPRGRQLLDWKTEHAALEEFLARMPFRAPLDRPVHMLSAGEKQKLEILKQLFLDQRFIILDEPTSVLTPDEADACWVAAVALTAAHRRYDGESA
jgi:Fe-S cluster assembly ATPase SufC